MTRADLLTALAITLAILYPVSTGSAGPGPVWGLALEGGPLTPGQLTDAEKETGLKPGLVVFFLQWPARPEQGFFPWATVEAADAQGAIPVLTWEPMYFEQGEQTIDYRRIVQGEYDPYLRLFAAEAKKWGRPLIIRLAHEMNLSRYHWGVAAKDYGPASPGIYQKIHRHVVGLFRDREADNVRWAFCPNAQSVPSPPWDKKAGWNTLEAYYPGPEWVDLVGLDGYNWGDTQVAAKHGWTSSWQGFRRIFQPGYRTLKKLAPRKPLVIFETASASSGGSKANWLREAVATLREWHVNGLAWFQAEKEVDWRLKNGIEPQDLEPLAGFFTSGPEPLLRCLGYSSTVPR